MAENARLFMLLTGPDGTLEGESRVAARRGWIEIDDWNWKLDPGANRDDRSAVRPSVLTFSKVMDKATTKMLAAMHKGSLLTATIVMEDASMNLFDLSLKLEKVRVINYSLNAQSGDKRLTVRENWTFDYEVVQFSYKADARSGAMQVSLTRPPGSPTTPVDNKESRFKELSADMSVQDLAPIWEKLKEMRREFVGTSKSPDEKGPGKATSR